MTNFFKKATGRTVQTVGMGFEAVGIVSMSLIGLPASITIPLLYFIEFKLTEPSISISDHEKNQAVGFLHEMAKGMFSMFVDRKLYKKTFSYDADFPPIDWGSQIKMSMCSAVLLILGALALEAPMIAILIFAVELTALVCIAIGGVLMAVGHSLAKDRSPSPAFL